MLNFYDKRQLCLALDDVQQYALKNVVKQTFADIRRKYPYPVDGETKEEWIEFIYIETLFEVAERIKKIAESRQKKKIDVMYGDLQNDTKEVKLGTKEKCNG